MRRSTKFSRPTSALNIRRCSKTWAWAAAVRVDAVAAAAKKAALQVVRAIPVPATERLTDSKREHRNLQTCNPWQANVCAWGRIQNDCEQHKQGTPVFGRSVCV